MSFTILTGKDGANPKKPLFLVTITAPDGDVCYLTTAAYYGAPNIVYNSTTYLARIQKNDIQAIQAISPQGYDGVPGFTMTLADADKYLWTNHCMTHGWRGAAVVLTVILWDVVANAYSTDALQWSFIGGNPQHNHAQGQTSLDVAASTNFTRLKVPSIPLEYRCPWDFPATAAQRTAALNDPTSPYYQCGYSPDQAGGVGNYASGTTPFTTCEFVRSSPTDPTVGCMARMGNAATTSVAPDGDLAHDTTGRYTARFGGVTWLAGAQFSGRQYTTGNKVFGFNQPNTALAGAYYNWVYGTQWVTGQVFAPAGDPNSLRAEVAICVAAFGAANVLQLLVNGVQIPQNNGDQLFTWRYINQGGRSGALNGDAIFDSHGDPHGSVCVIEFVVPAELAQPGSVPSVQALVTSGPILNCYAIASITGGVVTFTGPNWSCAGNSPFTVIVVGNSSSALNGIWPLSSWTYGPPGTITLTGTGASGTGGAVFFYQRPDLYDTGGSILSNPTGNFQNIAGPAANLAYAALDLLTWGNISLSQIDPASWYNAAQICAATLNYTAADGSTKAHAQFKASFGLPGNQRQTLAQVLTALRNSGNLMIAPNSTTGLIQCFVKQTLADQQPATIPGSNDTTARISVKADGTVANGYYAYLFDETVIEAGSLRVTATRIESTPNTVSFQFQDEYNGYQQDSLTEIDANAYAYSGNQEIAVPVPVNAVPNFDQGMRIANTQLAEALFGNPRNDPGGTLYFEFSTNHRVLHLASRLGYICGFSWQSLNIGVSSPQAIRILSLTPDTDGEHWQVKAAWHNDVWFTYAYGQDPTPYQNNPLLGPTSRLPYPWKPYGEQPVTGDLMHTPTEWSFSVAQNYAINADGTPLATLVIGGCPPVNQVSSAVLPPIMGSQGPTANVGGTIPGGQTLIGAISVQDANGLWSPLSRFFTVTIPAGTNTNTVTTPPITWKPGAAAYTLYMGPSELQLCAQASATGSTPGTITLTALNVATWGPPDVVTSAVEFKIKRVIHSGVWGAQVGVVGTGTLKFTGASFSTNQWAGYDISLVAKYNSAANIPIADFRVASNTADTLTVSPDPNALGIGAGDVFIMRTRPSTVTATTIGDANFANFYNSGSGLTTNAEKGNKLRIATGAGRGQVRNIVSNTSTVLTVDRAWDVMPDSTSRFFIEEPLWQDSPDVERFTANAPTPSPVPQIATLNVNNYANQTMLIQALTLDAAGNSCVPRYAPIRDIYQFGSQGTRTVTASDAQRVTDGTLLHDTTSASQALQLLSSASVRNQALIIRKSTTDANTVTINTDPGDYFPDGTQSMVLTNAGDNGAVLLKFPGTGNVVIPIAGAGSPGTAALTNEYSLTGPTTINSPGTPADGALWTVRLEQDITGGRAVSWGAGIFLAPIIGGGLNDAANTMCLVTFYGRAGNWYGISSILGVPIV
jgi:hypothetical protein